MHTVSGNAGFFDNLNLSTPTRAWAMPASLAVIRKGTPATCAFGRSNNHFRTCAGETEKFLSKATRELLAAPGAPRGLAGRWDIIGPKAGLSRRSLPISRHRV